MYLCGPALRITTGTGGREFEDRFLLDKALREYRFAVQLDPSRMDYRKSYAQVFKTLGFPAKYLTELEVIAKEGKVDQAVEDELEIQHSLQEDTLSSRWGVNQFNIDRTEYRIGLFAIPGDSDVIHYAGDEVGASLLTNMLQGRERIAVADGTVTSVDSYSRAFRDSRSRGDDYFVLVSFVEKPRSFTVFMDLYLSDNGTLLKRLKIFRTGNDRVTDAVSRGAEELMNSLPLKVRLIRRDFDRGLIDAGRFDGLTGDEEFLILPERSLSLMRNGLGFEYLPEDVAGKLKLSELDELVAEGGIETTGFFDYINEGDFLILPAEEVPEVGDGEVPLNGLYQELLTIQ